MSLLALPRKRHPRQQNALATTAKQIRGGTNNKSKPQASVIVREIQTSAIEEGTHAIAVGA